MQPKDLSHYSVYRTVIEQVMEGTESLPSLPSITIKVRNELVNPYTSNSKLAGIVEKDPALCALVIKSASNPLFNTASKPKNLEGTISLLGMGKLNDIVMLHSVKSLYIMRDPQLKTLYKLAWRRLITKATMSSLLAKTLKIPDADQVMITSLLTEVGTLAVLSALNNVPQTPDTQTYFRLCREYSKSLGVIILNKWGLGENYIKVIKNIGLWDKSEGDSIDVVDVINLGLYQSILWQKTEHDLPPLQDISVYKKLPPLVSNVHEDNILMILESRREMINRMVSVML